MEIEPERLLAGRRVLRFAGGPGGAIDRGPKDDGAAPLLLIHGFGGDALSWQFNVQALVKGVAGSPGRRVLAVDLPGHGASTLDIPSGLGGVADWVVRLMDALGVERADIVGHSMGGRVSLLLAERHPDRVRRMSLIACAGLGSRVDAAFLQALCTLETLDQARGLIDRLFGGAPPNREALARAFLARLANPAARAPLIRLLDRLVADIAAAPPQFDWTQPLPPLQLIWGEADDIVPPPDAGALPPHVPLHRLPGVGHMPQAQAATQVNTLLTEFHQ
ncbi:alpha/beta fold hydrolase [Nitrospirillum pindoramense]|uniref:Pyruvate dehydrogenase E2 component (Dihydrolipoamide acetyltransferase) n=1 Tax=Nitrospirillum amazonense TaxID=28077 RepID=A0A560GXM1_9PROT|nr:alpha/beta fold hydrolase [Nitrospirillum amazonense]TWB38591.1 pyruvate dehydrogenase E2 component (dihydrolipoamide acetyltransferase) [Nitrospirillum amazonense]